jgi:hypothetical protein
VKIVQSWMADIPGYDTLEKRNLRWRCKGGNVATQANNGLAQDRKSVVWTFLVIIQRILVAIILFVFLYRG